MITVDYITDQEKGNSLAVTDTDPGWVEFLQKTGKLYHCVGPKPRLYQYLQQKAKKNIVEQAVTGGAEKIGMIKSLANERLIQPFILPPMLTTDSTGNIEMSTGRSRLMAEIMCGTASEDLSFVLYTSTPAFEKEFDSVTEITSTKHFNQLYDLDTIDYKISMVYDEKNQIKFTGSVLRHGIYDFAPDDNKWFVSVGNKSQWFFDKFRDTETKKIQIKVRCTEDVAKFIPESNEHFTFEIFYEPASEWQFSYGRLLGAYRPEKKTFKHVLHLWVYDITEPLSLESLVLWCDADYAAYYTKNRKIAMFETTHQTSIKEIGDFVK
jgi:hypothetical protein